MKIILDTNVVISGFISKGSNNLTKIFKLLKRNTFEIISCENLIDEIKNKLNTPKIKDLISDFKLVTDFLTYLRYRSTFIEITENDIRQVCRDPKDDIFLALALKSKADYLISLDLDLLDMHTYESTKIIKPKTFLDLIN